jgi:predicted nucleotidyltransferase
LTLWVGGSLVVTSASTPMRAVPSPVAQTLQAFTGALGELLRSNFVGAYLYGSLTQGAFDPARSDIDCLVVVERDLTAVQLRKLRTWLVRAARTNAWIPRLQMQVLRRSCLLRPDARGCLYQFGVLKRCGSDGNPLVWVNVLSTGVTLAGPLPVTFLPRLTDEMIFEALVREVEYLHAEVTNPASEWRGRASYRAYAVLTLCRILYSYRMGGVASKPRAARWALRALPAPWHSLIREALASDRGKRASLPLTRIAGFIQFAESQLAHHTALAAPRSRRRQIHRLSKRDNLRFTARSSLPPTPRAPSTSRRPPRG